ncbi:MAG: ribonuclease P protein subunit [Methanothrix sp.]|nr:ribonuclease P protein subunit [Methanothrix sp.]OYV09223.1 MAG: ribonuclease P protein subunit POP4 [Methanosaeta sp. NSP1]
MNLRPENLARHELIGLHLTVEQSSNPCQAGLIGQVIDETRNTFLLETKAKVVCLAKKNTSLDFTLPSGQMVRIAGSVLISQPENRITKRMQKTRWKL